VQKVDTYNYMYSDNLAVKLKEASLATRFYAEILPPQWLIIDWWIVVLSILSGPGSCILIRLLCCHCVIQL